MLFDVDAALKWCDTVPHTTESPAFYRPLVDSVHKSSIPRHGKPTITVTYAEVPDDERGYYPQALRRTANGRLSEVFTQEEYDKLLKHRFLRKEEAAAHTPG